MRLFHGVRFIIVITLLAAVSGCGLFAVKEQQAKLDAFCRVGGQIDAERRDKVPLVVVLARLAGDDPAKAESWKIADHFVLERPGRWGFAVSAGTYAVVAFQDLNQDLKLQVSEPFLRLEKERTFTCKAGDRLADMTLRIPAAGRTRLTETVDVSALQVRSVQDQLQLSLSQVTAFGELVTLDDPRFYESVAEDGLWRPFDFLFKGRPGVYFLEPYDPNKIPVLFVHGINGTPINFRTLIDRLDRTRFQPWVYYYPSGASLANVADHLAQTMRKLQLQHGFRTFAVLAHSMGGLVSRGFLLRYTDGGSANVPLYITIATPWDGHKAAQSGIDYSPAVVRVWIDMVPNSEYLRSLYERGIGLPHYLLFAFRQEGRSSEANDGTVTVASQLRQEAQRDATRIEGYNETHMSVLEAKNVSERVNGLLATIPKPVR